MWIHQEPHTCGGLSPQTPSPRGLRRVKYSVLAGRERGKGGGLLTRGGAGIGLALGWCGAGEELVWNSGELSSNLIYNDQLSRYAKHEQEEKARERSLVELWIGGDCALN